MAASFDNEQTSRRLQGNLRELSTDRPVLSTLSQKGDDNLVKQFLTENVQIEGGANEKLQSQLYIACFWGFVDVVKSLLDGGADVNAQNKNSGWTPLHAASFQEHGKIIMLLLEKGANPEVSDAEGRTPKDFASASDKTWPHFAARGYTRTTKQDLIDKGIIRKLTPEEKCPSAGVSNRPGSGSKLAAYSRPGSAYVVKRDIADAHGDSVLQGPTDVLSSTEPSAKTARPGSGNQPNFLVWRS
ncbi:predicted protein [Nematostella vectensis]|uniref:Uncharacterized protein n=1 Tax=Nematostella vectensis TaxID=45351 RepID=A7RWN3_NEMVE|nr:predicted protein [Nematostella vectensis]|eukprot:XP_001636216.1 predicted protein [Nematostella vectensis]